MFHPGQAGATLSEVFAEGRAEAAAAGFVLAQVAHRPGAILWIQDRLAQREGGRPYLPGLGSVGPLMLMQLARPVDVMIAAEEGLRSPVLAAVVAEIRGDPSALTFTATKRLALRAEAAGVPCWLIRQGARAADASAARDRWRIALLPSAANPDDARAPGAARWQAELFRSRDGRPGTWVLRHDRDDGVVRAEDRRDLAAPFRDRTLEQGAGADRQRLAR